MRVFSKKQGFELPMLPTIITEGVHSYGHGRRHVPRYVLLLFLLALPFPAGAQSKADEAAQAQGDSARVAPAARTEKGSGSAKAVNLKPDARGMLSQAQMEELFRVVAEKDLENDKHQHDYTYMQRSEEHKLDGKGNVKSIESKTYEVLNIYGEEVDRLVAKDDKALSAKDAAKEEKKIQDMIDKRKNESEKDREKRLAKEEKEREDGRQFVREIADAYNFHLVGSEMLNGRHTYVIDAEPRPGYQPHRKEAKFLPKIRGRVWIDEQEQEWVKLNAQVIDTVSIGLFLARLHKGTDFMVEMMRINDEVWLPKHMTAKVDIRLALLKNFNVAADVTYRDYKKFRIDSKIVGVGELK
jgi:hypothetical protein